MTSGASIRSTRSRTSFPASSARPSPGPRATAAARAAAVAIGSRASRVRAPSRLGAPHRHHLGQLHLEDVLEIGGHGDRRVSGPGPDRGERRHADRPGQPARSARDQDLAGAELGRRGAAPRGEREDRLADQAPRRLDGRRIADPDRQPRAARRCGACPARSSARASRRESRPSGRPRTAGPSTSPVEASTPEATSAATIGAPQALIASIARAAGSRGGAGEAGAEDASTTTPGARQGRGQVVGGGLADGAVEPLEVRGRILRELVARPEQQHRGLVGRRRRGGGRRPGRRRRCCPSRRRHASGAGPGRLDARPPRPRARRPPSARATAPRGSRSPRRRWRAWCRRRCGVEPVLHSQASVVHPRDRGAADPRGDGDDDRRRPLARVGQRDRELDPERPRRARRRRRQAQLGRRVPTAPTSTSCMRDPPSAERLERRLLGREARREVAPRDGRRAPQASSSAGEKSRSRRRGAALRARARRGRSRSGRCRRPASPRPTRR